MEGEVHRARTATRGRRGPSRTEREDVAQMYRKHAESPVKAIVALRGYTERNR